MKPSIPQMTSKLAALPKTSSFTAALKPDSRIPTPETALANKDNIIHTPRILESGAYSYTIPESRQEYQHLTSSDNALRDLGLDPQEVDSAEYQQIVTGQLYNDASFTENGYPFPYAQAYAGWQFGQFAGQLGDGRVFNLFEVPKAHQNNGGIKNRSKYELQLKGAGLTPFSRFADGKAVLRSSIREYIISEHLNAIGIPTTRALSLTLLPQTLARRLLPEKCAIVARFAESWVRLGSFDLYRWRGDRKGIRELADYCINELFTINHTEKFPAFNESLTYRNDFFQELGEDDQLTDYDKFYFETIVRNAVGTSKWQVYGFLNGVLNTDNTSVLGLSMDYGPFSIMDKFNPGYTPNSEDHESRYGYRNTPTAIWWNLTRFGENLAELIGAGSKYIDDETFNNKGITTEMEDDIIKRATKIIEMGGQLYTYSFTRSYVETFFQRLGLSPELINQKEPDDQNQELIVPLLKLLEKLQCDYNKFFMMLLEIPFKAESMDMRAVASALKPKEHDLFDEEELIDLITKWLNIYQQYLSKSEALGFDRSSSKQYNPLFLPRNWILDEVITHTEKTDGRDLSYLKKLEKMSFHPFDRSQWGPELKDVEEKWLVQGDLGDSYSMLQCSCSS